MDIVLTTPFGSSARLAAELIPCAHPQADPRPFRAVLIGSIRPQAIPGKCLHGFVRDADPVAGGLQFGRWKIERFLPQVTAAQPLAFSEARHLRGDLQLSVGLAATAHGGAFNGIDQAHLGLAQRFGVVIEGNRDQRGCVAGQVELLDKILHALMQVNGVGVDHPGGGG